MWFLAVASLLLVILAAFHVAEAQKQNVPEKIRIGYTVSLSGRFTPMVGTFKKLGDSWAELVNQRGGIYMKEYGKKLPVEFVVYDDKSDPAVSTKFYERLITQDKVDFLLGPFSSHISFAASTVAEKHKVPMILICANDLKIFERNYKYSATNLAEANQEFYRYLEILKSEGKAKTLAMIAEDTLHSTGVLTGGEAKAKELGLQVVFKEIMPATTRDFTAIITRLKALNPDVVMVEAFPAFEIPFGKQAYELKLQPKELYFGHITKAVVNALGPSAENLASTTYWAEEWKDNAGVADYMAILEKTGIKWDEYMESAIRMAAYQRLQAVLEKVGSLDREKIRTAMWETTVPTISGNVSINQQGLGTLVGSPVQVRGGRFISIYPVENAKKNHIFPNPWK